MGLFVIVQSWPSPNPSEPNGWLGQGRVTSVEGSWQSQAQRGWGEEPLERRPFELEPVPTVKGRLSPKTIEPSEPPPRLPRKPEEKPQGPIKYRVKKGDTYWELAKRIYGDGSQHGRIQELNRGIPPEKLKPGVWIWLPPLSQGEKLKENRSRSVDHRVRRGESLSEIAVEYYGNANWAPIVEANPKLIRDPRLIREGMILKIPLPEKDG